MGAKFQPAFVPLDELIEGEEDAEMKEDEQPEQMPEPNALLKEAKPSSAALARQKRKAKKKNAAPAQEQNQSYD